MGSAATASEWERVIGELTRGREIADELLSILRKSRGDGESVVGTGVMVEKILESFTDSLSILSATAGTGGESDEVVSQISNLIKAVPKSEDSGESCKTPTPKDRRGCYKRRRTSKTWTKESPSLYEDGHAWRKYGQKSILHAKHPRNYFRCTHKYDQGCQATKQVQKVQDQPTLYRTTYHDQHTCKKLNESSLLLDNHHHLIMDSTTHHHSSSVIWSFQSSLLQHDQDYPKEVLVKSHQQITKSSSSSLMSHNNSNNIHNYQQLAASDHLTTSSFQSSPASRSDVMSSDVYSCCTSATATPLTLSMDMAGIMNYDDFPYYF